MNSRTRTPVEGEIFQFPLGPSEFGFCQVAQGGDFAFFKLRSARALPLDIVASSQVAFRVPMAANVNTFEGWSSLGIGELRGNLRVLASYWNRAVGSSAIRIVTGSQLIPASAEEVAGVEQMAWWDDVQVIRRLEVVLINTG